MFLGCNLELEQLEELVGLLILPTTCYHTWIEEYFEWSNCKKETNCIQFCSCWFGEVKHFTKRVSKDGLILLLSTQMNISNTALSVNELLKLLKTSKDLIFHNDNIPKTNQMSQVHALALQMFGK